MPNTIKSGCTQSSGLMKTMSQIFKFVLSSNEIRINNLVTLSKGILLFIKTYLLVLPIRINCAS